MNKNQKEIQKEYIEPVIPRLKIYFTKRQLKKYNKLVNEKTTKQQLKKFNKIINGNLKE